MWTRHLFNHSIVINLDDLNWETGSSDSLIFVPEELLWPDPNNSWIKCAWINSHKLDWPISPDYYTGWVCRWLHNSLSQLLSKQLCACILTYIYTFTHLHICAWKWLRQVWNGLYYYFKAKLWTTPFKYAHCMLITL